jgi:Fe-Mn family superoxide dismutase
MFKSVKLPYSNSALEPYIDAETMDVHYNKHYLTYLKNVNDELKKANVSDLTIEELMENINEFSDAIRNNGGGYYNHSLFWNMLRPNIDNNENLPTGLANILINRDFGNYKNFKSIIEKYAKKRFGSGWVWWVILPSGKTRILELPYQDNPKMYFDCEILLGIDVWEHAYYLKYKSDRAGYIDNLFKVINWEYVNDILKNYYY